MAIRQPIITVCGHVDHGKTSILDSIRKSSVAAKEAGGITQKISFTLFPAKEIKKGCYLLDKYNYALEIPGFLFIDTPGHAAFTNLRKRGGSLADLAILVVDINEGIKPQTSEVLQILKANKTPFLVALNKIDAISGWRKMDEDLKKSIESQALHAKQNFDEKLYIFEAALNSYGFGSELFYNLTDFAKKVAIVPCSAKTGEGIPEILMMLCGLSQKFLKGELSLGEKAMGVILEIKKEKAVQYLEAILYDGKLKVGDEIAIASFGEPVKAKIRGIEEIQPLSFSFKSVKEATAATGLRIQLVEKTGVLPGMPFQLLKGNIVQIEKEFAKEIGESIKTGSEGIIVKAESLGSLEALLILLKQENIPILKAGIGNISKSDILSAKANMELNPLNAVILGFNVELDEEVTSIQQEAQVKILLNNVIYRLIEDIKKWQEDKRKEIEKTKLLELAPVCKLEILHNFVFHNSKPAIFGVRVIAGKLKPRIEFTNEKNEKIGRVKNIQQENKSIDEADSGMEVAISIPGVTFDRQLKDVSFLYSELGEAQFRKLKENKELLSAGELSVLQEIAQIKRKEKITWGV